MDSHPHHRPRHSIHRSRRGELRDVALRLERRLLLDCLVEGKAFLHVPRHRRAGYQFDTKASLQQTGGPLGDSFYCFHEDME